MERVELTDGRWRVIEPLPPPERGSPGRPTCPVRALGSGAAAPFRPLRPPCLHLSALTSLVVLRRELIRAQALIGWPALAFVFLLAVGPLWR